MTPRYFVVPFKRWHISWLEEQGLSESGSHLSLSPEVLHALELQNSRTIFLDDGHPLMCGGALMQWPGRHIVWAYLNKRTAPHMTYITRHTKKYLAELPGRLELTVRKDFKAGHRWAGMLGFDVELYTLRKFGPEGEDHTLYTRHN